jgi:uncharacterized protein
MSGGSAVERDSFVLGQLEAEPGSTRTGYCDVDLGSQTIQLPVAVIHGANPGPRLAVTAGIHGGEYVPILAVRRFLQSLDPTAMHGTVILSLQSSPLAFKQRSAFVNPIDGKNLNRSFPGDPDGGPTERLADWLWKNVISQGDYYVDCHCGDLPESLDGFTGVVRTSDPKVNAESFRLADCFRVARTITTKTQGSTVFTAASAGIPSVLIEHGDRGAWADEEVDVQFAGLSAVAASVGIVSESAREPRAAHPIFQTTGRLTADQDGLWFPRLEPGSRVSKGDVIGTIEDPFGALITSSTAPCDGIYIYGLSALSVHAGDFLASIAQPVEGWA